jgi:hypothetical protein
VYIVKSSSTKSTTLTLTDIGSFQKFSKKWNRTPKGSSNFSNVRVYLFVNTRVHSLVVPQPKVRPSHQLTSVPSKKKIFQNETERRKARQFLVMREPIFSLERCNHCVESSHPQPKVRLSHQPTSVPSKIFKMEPNAERLVKILDVIAYLFVGTIVTIMCRVKSSPTKSTIITSTDIGPSKIFKKWNRTPKGSSKFWM